NGIHEHRSSSLSLDRMMTRCPEPTMPTGMVPPPASGADSTRPEAAVKQPSSAPELPGVVGDPAAVRCDPAAVRCEPGELAGPAAFVGAQPVTAPTQPRAAHSAAATVARMVMTSPWRGTGGRYRRSCDAARQAARPT